MTGAVAAGKGSEPLRRFGEVQGRSRCRMPHSRWIKSRLQDESGFALVLALAIMVALGTAVTSITFFSTANFHSSTRQRSTQSALALAEAGLNLAYSTLAQAPDPTSPTA